MGIRIQFGDTLNDGSTNVCCQHYLDNNNKKMFRYWLCVDNVFPPPIIWEKLYLQIMYCKSKNIQAEEKETDMNQKTKPATCCQFTAGCESSPPWQSDV